MIEQFLMVAVLLAASVAANAVLITAYIERRRAHLELDARLKAILDEEGIESPGTYMAVRRAINAALAKSAAAGVSAVVIVSGPAMDIIVSRWPEEQ